VLVASIKYQQQVSAQNPSLQTPASNLMLM